METVEKTQMELQTAEVSLDPRTRMMACLGKTEADTEKTEHDPGMMQSTEGHQEIPKREVAVMPAGPPRKWRGVRNLAAERRQKRKEGTRGNHGSRRKSAAACRKVSRRAKMTWRKRNHVTRNDTQINYGRRKRLNVTGRKTTRRATVAWHNENVVRKDCARDQAKRGTPKRRKYGGLWNFPECNNGIRDQGIKQELHSRKRIKDLGDRLPLCPRNERTFGGIYRKTIGLDTVKRAVWISSGMRKIKDWTLWTG
jgi:hypothetical protein